MAVVKVNYLKGKKAPGGAAAAGDYYTHRDGPDRSQRIWFEPSGARIEKWRDIRAEIRDEAREHKYTYRIVLSQEQGRFEPEHYREVVQAAGLENSYLVVHENTEHPHAHAIAFTDKRINRKDLAAMRGRMSELEQELGKSAEAGLAVSRDIEQEGGLER